MNVIGGFRVGGHLSERSLMRNFHRYVIIFMGGGVIFSNSKLYLLSVFMDFVDFCE